MDLIERLRLPFDKLASPPTRTAMAERLEAADKIERLEATIAWLRANSTIAASMLDRYERAAELKARESK